MRRAGCLQPLRNRLNSSPGVTADCQNALEPPDWCLKTSNGRHQNDQPTQETLRQYQAQQLRRMLSFMGPALLIPLGDPLMTLVDTVCIGQFAGTTQLAALGPSNMIFNMAQYVFQSLQVATMRCVCWQGWQQQYAAFCLLQPTTQPYQLT
jgi:hypothetical protein